MVYGSLCPPPPQRAGQEAEGRVGMRGLVMGLGATLSPLGVGQPRVNPCKFGLGTLDSEVPTRTVAAGLLPIWGTTLFFKLLGA